MDIATFQQGGCIAIDISTRIDVPSRTIVKRVFILSVTTAKDFSNLVGTIHQDIRLRNCCGITAAIDTLNTNVTLHNFDISLLASCGIVSQVTTTIDGGKFITRSHIPCITWLLSSIAFENL